MTGWGERPEGSRFRPYQFERTFSKNYVLRGNGV
jgi:hypothetical protein